VDTDSRDSIIKEAMTWMDTRYHHAARIKGHGVDCINFICAVYEGCKLISKVKLPYYSKDWYMHRNEELFINEIKKYCTETEKPEKGDIILYRFGRCYSHGAIYIGDDRIIHSHAPEKVTIDHMHRFSDRHPIYYQVNV
jgi:cell wall-associated NlpC family hydrolase